MATPALTEPALNLEEGRSNSAAGTHPAVLGIESGLLLWACFPPLDWGWFAWVALVPLFLLVQSRRPGRQVYLGAWLGGLVFWTPAIQWVRLSDPSSWLGWLVMAAVLACFWPVFVGLSRWAVFRLRLPLVVAAPIVWVALEYVRAYLVSGFPWYYLAHTQHAFLPLIQVADLTGSLGLSLLVAVVNAWVVELMTLPLLRQTPRGSRLTHRQSLRVGVIGVWFLATLGYGAFRLSTSNFRPGPRVALLQSSIHQRLKMGGDPNAMVDRYRALTERALRLPERPDLIVWPETSYPFGVVTIDPQVDDAELGRQVKRFAPKFAAASWRAHAADVAGHLRSVVDSTTVPVLIGAINYDHRPGGHAKYNSALLLTPGTKAIQSYHKMHLVPFGEYVPLIRAFPWLTVLTPYHGDDVPSLTFGPGPRWLDVGPYRIAAAICFEDTVPQVVRRFFAETPDGRHPDVLVNLSNDGWFGGSSEHEMHLVASIFRAIEHRVPMARAANTGISAIVDGDGRVLQSLATRDADGWIVEGVVSGVVPLDDRTSYYTVWGDWLGLSCLAVTIGLVPLGLVRRRDVVPR
jgi:apolipoprotein N-acyltransferase